MPKFSLARFLFGDWRSASEAHVVNAIHLAVVLIALWVAKAQGAAGPTFDFVAMTAIATTVAFGLGRLARTSKPAASSKG